MKPARPVLLALTVVAGCSPYGGKDPAMKKLFGPSPPELVKQMFESRDPDLRRDAIEKLSSHDWGRRDPYLKGYAFLATDPAPTVRSACVRALGLGRDSRYVKPVMEAMEDADPGVRWDAGVALDSIIDPQAAKPLCYAAVFDQVADVRLAAARALRHYRTQAVLETLLRGLDDGEFSVRYQAGESLKELTGESPVLDRRAWQRVLAAKGDPFSVTTRPSQPWWDWMGVTQRERPAPARPGAGGAPEEPSRPWWDWMGVTAGKEPSPRPPEPAASRADRPWWDWMGATGPKNEPSTRPVVSQPSRPPPPTTTTVPPRTKWPPWE